MNLNGFYLISVVSAVLYFLILVFVLVKTKIMVKSAGKIIISFKKKNILFQILTMIFSALLVFIIGVKSLGVFTDSVVCLVALLGCYMSSNEILANGFCGLYENGLIGNGLIGNGHFLPFEKILELPLLSASNEGGASEFSSSPGIDPRILLVKTERNSAEQFIFSSGEEKDFVQKEILKRNPGLSC